MVETTCSLTWASMNGYGTLSKVDKVEELLKMISLSR